MRLRLTFHTSSLVLSTLFLCACTQVYPQQSDILGAFVNERTGDTVILKSFTLVFPGEQLNGVGSIERMNTSSTVSKQEISYSGESANSRTIHFSAYRVSPVLSYKPNPNMTKPWLYPCEVTHCFWQINIENYAALSLQYEGFSSQVVLSSEFPWAQPWRDSDSALTLEVLRKIW